MSCESWPGLRHRAGGMCGAGPGREEDQTRNCGHHAACGCGAQSNPLKKMKANLQSRCLKRNESHNPTPPSDPGGDLGAEGPKLWLGFHSWANLGPSRAPLGGPLGPSWGHLEASEAHRKRKGENAKNIEKQLLILTYWGPLGGFLEAGLDNVGTPWGYLGAYWGCFGGPSRGRPPRDPHSRALQGPSWSLSGALTPATH